MSFACPYGCGATFGRSHLFCRGELLTRDKAINFDARLIGGFDPAALPAGTLPAVVNGVVCERCFKVFKGAHKKCRGQKLPGPVKARDQELDYQQVLYLDGLSVKQGGRVTTCATLEELVAFLLSQKRATVLYQHTAELGQALLGELKQADSPGQMNTVNHLTVPKAFTAYNLSNYSLTSLDDFEASNRMVFQLTGWNLTSKWTLAQLAYEYWKGQSAEQHILQGEMFQFSKRAYYGARSSAVKGHWRSKLADRIEAGEFSYDELLADPTLDVKFQLDINSMYPAVMRGFEGFETYYPAGEARWVPQTEAEQAFRNGQVGMYAVTFERPEGLRIGILPVRVGPKSMSWPIEPGQNAGVYTEVDLRLAEEYGYQLSFTGDALVWDEVGHPFNDYVDKLYALKQARPKREATMAKLMLNCLYGKFGQARQGSAEAQVKKVTADEFFVHVCENGGEYDSNRTHGDDYYIRLSAPQTGTVEIENYKPNHLGAYITAWTRKLLVEAMEVIDFSFDFCHTDSLRVSAADFSRLRENGYLDEGALGRFKVDHGVIFEVHQENVNNYRLKVWTRDNEVKVVSKGAKFK